HDAGERILAGQIQRGDTHSMRAVIWFSDLRGFTSMSSALPPATIIATLNDVFDCQVPAIELRGGEVLKYMGDGMLAIFPIVDDSDAAVRARCDEAIAAAQEAFASLDALNGRRGGKSEAPVRFGIALHIGDIAYGNIGGANRLDFTCIGSAVNLAARLETLTAKLSKNLVVSEDIARHTTAPLDDLGLHELKGVPTPSRAFSPRS
ncbi:MAG TPA: adenylate/guanylate cyclase domain-containing protein, partial [Myxococcota bacterium]